MARKPKKPRQVEALRHKEARRRNLPTAELESVMQAEERKPVIKAFERRDPDLDPQLVWRGKDVVNPSALTVAAPPLFIQEKIQPKAIIDALIRESRARREEREKAEERAPDLFADFNGLDDPEAATEFYKHDANWTNRMILGDALQVMASLAEREGLKGQVQCIYIDPPYGIKFNSNFQWSTTSRDVKDGSPAHITREPEQVKAFRDTWRDGIHSYLTYLRDRLTVARELLSESGSIFVQIGDENVHRVRCLMDEVFGEENFVREVLFQKTGGLTQKFLPRTCDFILWYAKNAQLAKFRRLFLYREENESEYHFTRLPDGRIIKTRFGERPEGGLLFSTTSLESENPRFSFFIRGQKFEQRWKTNTKGLSRLEKAARLADFGKTLRYIRYHSDFPVRELQDIWLDTMGERDMMYVVQTNTRIVERCILMTTDPGDLVLDPTCGSGTTAYVAEQWGRRWITIDTSRVALALARARIMGARFPYYLLKDSPEGQLKLAEITGKPPSDAPTYGDIRQGFVYERVPHITLKSIANNAEIDEIWERLHPAVDEALAALNAALKGHGTPFEVRTGGRAGQKIDFTTPEGETVTLPSGEEAPANALLEWEVPHEAPSDWPQAARAAFEAFWAARRRLQKEIDESIARNADTEYLYDRPYQDRNRVRVAGPFTVESVSPHRVLAVDANDELIDVLEASEGHRRAPGGDGGQNDPVHERADFLRMVLENLKAAGVQQAHKEDRITFSSLDPWPGEWISAVGRYGESRGDEGETERRAAIFVGPEFGTVQRADLVAAAREAAEAGFDMLIACAFSFDAHASDLNRLGRIPILKARMNADLHMGDELKSTASANLFVVFGEPDIDIETLDDGRLRVRVNGVDVFKPLTGRVESSGPEGIACWFIDTDYNEESFFVRHAYFLGMNGDPYKALKTSLKAEVDREAWESLYTNVSRPFPRPTSGRIAVKVINHLGDEVMKVYEV